MFTFLLSIFLTFVVALIVALILPFRYWPKRKSMPIRKGLGLTLGGLMVVCFILLVIAVPTTKITDQSVEISPTKVVVSTNLPINAPTKAITSPVPTKNPLTIHSQLTPTNAQKSGKTQEQILQGVLDKYGKNDNDALLQQNGQWYLVKFFNPNGDTSLQRATALSRNFIFDTYATKLPIREVTFNFGYFPDSKTFQAFLCSDIANQQPQSIWTENNNADPFGDNFYKFLNDNARGNPGDDCSTGAINNLQ